MKKILIKLNTLLTIAFFLLLLVISFAPYWPHRFWWLANLVQIAPLWAFFLPIGFLVIISFAIKQRKIFFLHTVNALILIFPIMGFQIPLSTKRLTADRSKIIKAATIDLGKTVDMKKVQDYIKEVNPDIIAFQETFATHQDFLKEILPKSEWDLSFDHELALASRFPIIESDLADRRHITAPGDGDVAAKYTLRFNNKPFYIFNVTFESPRKGLEAIIDRKLAAIPEMKKTTSQQETESFGVSKWVGSRTPVLITGDFNHLITNPMHREHWPFLKDAFSQAGFGFGYTKYTSVHGVRIDHYLYSREFDAIKASVGPDLGADHRPLSVEFVYNEGQLERITKETRNKEETTLPDNMAFLISENFEYSKGVFASNNDSYLIIDPRNAFKNTSSLRVSLPTQLNEYSAGININEWMLKKFPFLTFAYRIPDGMPVTLRVKTSFDEWVCLGKTKSSACSQIKDSIPVTLVDDGAWHEIEIDVRAFMQSILPAIKTLRGFEFYFPQNRHNGDIMLIDNFRVFGARPNQ